LPHPLQRRRVLAKHSTFRVRSPHMRHIVLSAAAAAAAVGLAGCASTYESRIRSSLVDAGLSQPMASCMAQRMVDRLSGSQLRSLARLSGLRDRDIGEMRVDEFLSRSRALVDPEVFVVISRAGLGCAIAG
jgi:hypothetical protein